MNKIHKKQRSPTRSLCSSQNIISKCVEKRSKKLLITAKSNDGYIIDDRDTAARTHFRVNHTISKETGRMIFILVVVFDVRHSTANRQRVSVSVAFQTISALFIGSEIQSCWRSRMYFVLFIASSYL